MQQKDIIYIDVEDDITAIIGKVKDAKLKIVALVPPKRTGVLQSSVNLRLLARAADNADKKLVLITHNAALSGLAASADIPVAKTLQSRPEMAKLPAVEDDEEDVINGDQLAVGDHAGISDESDDDKVPESAVAGLNIDGEPTSIRPKATDDKKPKAKKGISVPNFGSFRKKIAFIGAGVVLLGVFLYWALAIAPHATIIVSAKTTGQSISTPVTLGADLTTDSEKMTIKSFKQSEKISQSIDFDATGSKNVGDKATGTVKFTKSTPNDVTIPSGTHLTSSGGLTFITTSSVTVPGATVDFIPPYLHPSSATVGVEADEGGTSYNGASGSLSGGPQGVTTAFTSPTSGGTDKMAKVVTQEDVEKAKEELADQNKDDALKKLKEKFSDDDIVIESSFTTSDADQTSDPDIGEQVDAGKAKLTSEITYTLVGISKDEMNAYLDNATGNILTNKNTQHVYDNGLKSVNFADFKSAEDKEKTDSATLTATAQIGPKIDEDQIKEQSKGNRSGEIIGDIKAIDGVSDVDVKLSPFWVQGVPDDVKKISVEFKLIQNG